jgi:hypothetical protein
MSRPSWCRAASPRECDHPHGCTACLPKRHTTASKPTTVKEIASAIKAFEHHWINGVPQRLGTVRSAEVKEGVLHVQVQLTDDGVRFVKELEEQGSVPLWFYPTPVGLVNAPAGLFAPHEDQVLEPERSPLLGQPATDKPEGA